MQYERGLPVHSEYPTELPETFPIGALRTRPLVNVAELQAHLKLLGAIHRLKQTVQAQENGIAAKNKDQAWVIFVNRAVHRFYLWAMSSWTRASPWLDETIIPPLDIIMVWHSYLLNPRTYYEDSQRMDTAYCMNLQAIQNMPLLLIASLIDTRTLEALPPSAERQRFFETTTSLPFAPPLVTNSFEVMVLNCPFCLQNNHRVRWIAENEKGFAQTRFEHPCERCGVAFKKMHMGVRRFAAEVSRKRTGKMVYISETLLDPRTGRVDKAEADSLTVRLFKRLDKIAQVNIPITEDKERAEATSLAVKLYYSYEILSLELHTSIRPSYMSNPMPLPRIQRIAVAYSHNGPASLDLVGAVLRQGAFVEKMVHIGWTQPGCFDYEHTLAPLVRSIARYHAFLDLMCSHSKSFLVPTLDIDLAWHSHQLKGEAYRNDTLNFLERTPNHEDSVESSVISKGYDSTAKLWKKRFGVPYSLCGCIPDKDSEAIISKVTSKISTIGKKDKEEGPIPPPFNGRPDLVTIKDDEADSSHPSEHNLHFDNPNSPETRRQGDSRRKKSMHCVESAKKGAARDRWRALQAARSEKRDNESHYEAFTDPYSGYGVYYLYWGVSAPYPPGFYGGYGYQDSGGTGYSGCGNGCGSAGCSSGGCGGGGCGGGGCGS